MLAEICKIVGLPTVQDSKQHSDWVCNPRGWKIRNLGQFYLFTKAAITSMASTQVKSGKHTLDMLDKASPAWRKSKSVGVNLPAVKSPSTLQSIIYPPEKKLIGTTSILARGKGQIRLLTPF